MEAQQNSISRFMEQRDARFYIPVYQRNYDWKEEQCKQLLKDILAAGKNEKIDSHFIGSIVFIQMNLITSSPQLTIIDGQQRLTTLTLFIAAIVKLAKENNRSDLANKLTDRFLINDESDEDEKLKLKPIKKDDLSLRFALGLHHSEINEYSRVIENFNYFYSNVNANEIDIAYRGFQKLIFIEIALDKLKDDPQKIFQSLNSTGLDLSQADLIRNYILMDREPKEQEYIYTKYWVVIENNTTEKISKSNRMSDFIRDFLTFKFSNIPNQNKVFEIFREKFSFELMEDLELLLIELKEYSRYYKYLINPDLETNETIKLNLKLIKKLQINVSYPFILQVYKAYSDGLIDASVFIKTLEIVQSFVWRRFIAGLATNALNKIFMDLYKSTDINDFVNSLYISLIKKTSTQRFPNNDEIIKELDSKDMYNIQPKNRTYFLERLENYGQRIQIQIDGNDEISIEHIFPRNPVKEWKENLNDGYEIFLKLVHTAPNLTLSAFNSELSNSVFCTKRDLTEKGYKDSPLRIDKLLAEFDEWNLPNYNIRKDWITKRFFEIWKYPDIVIEDTDGFDEKNILDFEPSEVIYKSIDYFIFFDEKYENKNWTDLLSITSKLMFELEPEQFLNTDLGNKLKLTSDPLILLRPLKISNTYFIESNLGSKDIVKRVQCILEQCEKDDELILKIRNY